MSGAATFSGTNYQGNVLGFVYVHILKEAPLGWFSQDFIDMPTAVSGETEGPGDDARVEFGDRHAPIEVQAKHGLTAGAKLSEALRKAAARREGNEETEIVLVVDRGSSQTVRLDFAVDLERFRAGRTESLRSDIKRIIAEGAASAEVLRMLRVVSADLDGAADPEWKIALQLLEGALTDSSRAAAAWAVLTKDAGQVCAKRLRRTRPEIVDLLTASGINVRPPEPDESAMRQLDMSRRLLQEQRPAATLSYLELIETDLREKQVAPTVWVRLWQHRAAALLMSQRFTEALVSAREALAIEPGNRHALLTASQAAAESGDLVAAQRYVSEVLKHDPDNAEAWAARVQIDTKAGAPPSEPPKAVRESVPYQFALAQIALNDERFADVVAIARPLVATGNREPQVVLLLTTALIGLSTREEAEVYQKEAERLADEALGKLSDEHRLAVRFLAQRAELRRLRGDTDGCASDLARARQIREEEPNALAQLALSQLHAGQAEAALQTLTPNEVEKYPMLLLLRARVRFVLNDRTRAQADWSGAVASAESAPEPDALRLNAADLAVDMGDVSAAEGLLRQLAGDAVTPEMLHVVRGRIAFEKRDAQAMDEAFRAAADVLPTKKQILFLELAQRLVRLGMMREGAAVFEEVGWNDLPPTVHADYASALLGANHLVRAETLVADAVEDPSAPDWKLHVAAEIAVRRGDVGKAVALLARVAERHPDSAEVSYELARRFLAMRETAAATPHLDALLKRSATFRPQVMMAVAFLLKSAGRNEEARALALRAYRAAPQDPSIHRGFGNLLVTDTTPIAAPSHIGADTYFRLVADGGDTLQYVVYAEAPADPLRHELLLDEAARAGYVGKQVGDVIVADAGSWQEKRWRVEEILPASTYVWRDIMAHFKARFPGEPFFVASFKMSAEPSMRELAPIVSSVYARRERVESVYKLSREQTLPLGFVAGMLDIGLADAMAGAMTREFGPLATEWVDAVGQEISRAAARTATKVVLTRSALETLLHLDLLEIVRTHFEWVVPHSLNEALERECEDAEEHVAVGQRTLASGETGLRMEEWAPDHPALVARQARATTQRTWVAENARVEFRPLETIGAPDSDDEEMRATIGEDSMDAVHLADHLGIVLYADDLGLRRFGPRGVRAASFSSIGLLPVLAEKAVISDIQRDHLLLRLIDREYTAVPPTKELLLAVLKPSEAQRDAAAKVFGLLGHPSMELDRAAALAAEVLRDSALAPLQTTWFSHVAALVLEGMSLKWPAPLCSAALEEAVRSPLALMPAQREIVRECCKTFLRGSAELPRIDR
jgi:tetratricopeptide (TPR) repeat protein